jgi:hypothetical protein
MPSFVCPNCETEFYAPGGNRIEYPVCDTVIDQGQEETPHIHGQPAPQMQAEKPGFPGNMLKFA